MHNDEINKQINLLKKDLIKFSRKAIKSGNIGKAAEALEALNSLQQPLTYDEIFALLQAQRHAVFSDADIYLDESDEPIEITVDNSSEVEGESNEN